MRSGEEEASRMKSNTRILQQSEQNTIGLWLKCMESLEDLSSQTYQCRAQSAHFRFAEAGLGWLISGPRKHGAQPKARVPSGSLILRKRSSRRDHPACGCPTPNPRIPAA